MKISTGFLNFPLPIYYYFFKYLILMFLVGGYWCDHVEISSDFAIGTFWSCLNQRLLPSFVILVGYNVPTVIGFIRT